jgi:hypothetical protein
MPRDLTFQALKLLSQYIVSNREKIPEGEIFQRTSCMNPADAEFVGLLIALADLMKEEDPKIAKELNDIANLFEKMGIASWVHGELTHLGFRAGTRYEEQVDVANDSSLESVIDVVDEASINASAAEKNTNKE